MQFSFQPEHAMAQQLFRNFTAREVAPLAREVDETGRFPRETVDKMAAYGWLGIPFPTAYGGQGCDTLTYILAVEELAKACATTSVILSAHTSLCADAIMRYGTPQQKEQYLTPLARGEQLGAFALTEAAAGTDAGGQQTRADADGDHWVLNGSKIFITNAGEADVYVVFAMTDKAQGTRGISAFIVEKGAPGFTWGPPEEKMGIHGSSTRELIFIDCRIPKDALLGKAGRGFSLAMGTLDGGRIGIAAQALGIAEGALQKTVAYVKERKQFGRSLSKFQNTQFRLADMQTEIEAARWLVYRAAWLKDQGENYTVAAAMAKLKAAEVANDVTGMAVQLLGGYGYMREYDVERMMRDAKITGIYEGTSEVQRMVIGGALLK